MLIAYEGKMVKFSILLFNIEKHLGKLQGAVEITFTRITHLKHEYSGFPVSSRAFMG